MQTPTDAEMAKALGLVLFTGRFIALIEDGGFSLVRSLSLLEDMEPPFGPAAARIRAHVEIGHRLSDAMALESGLFSPFYVRMVRVGEIGGVLEMTLRRAADLILKEWRMIGRRPPQERLFLTPALSLYAGPDDWCGLSDYQRTVVQLLFCESFGSLLSFGVPILTTLDVVRSWLPTVQAALLAEARADVATGQRIRIERLKMLPAVVSELIAHGEQEGKLDATLLKSAQILEHELEARTAFACAGSHNHE